MGFTTEQFPSLLKVASSWALDPMAPASLCLTDLDRSSITEIWPQPMPALLPGLGYMRSFRQFSCFAVDKLPIMIFPGSMVLLLWGQKYTLPVTPVPIPNDRSPTDV